MTLLAELSTSEEHLIESLFAVLKFAPTMFNYALIEYIYTPMYVAITSAVVKVTRSPLQNPTFGA